MVIFLPIVLTPTAGTATFARKFQAGMKERGHSVVFTEPRRYDAVLVPASCSPRRLLRAQRKRIPIIQRLDGVYYPQSVAGRNYRWHNLPLKLVYHAFASRVIFQSEYSRLCAAAFLGPTTAVPTTVIYNGVDTNHFSPVGEATNLRQNAEQHIFITWSRFRRPDQIIPLLAAVKRYRQQYTTNCRLIIAGDFSGAVAHILEQLRRLPYIEWRGVVANQDLPPLARGADVFLFSHQNPPCPNNVLEAMACGLPICGVADGAMPEITKPGYTGELATAPGSGFWSARPFNSDEFVSNIARILERRPAYGAAGRQTALAHFSLENMIDRYESFIFQ